MFHWDYPTGKEGREREGERREMERVELDTPILLRLHVDHVKFIIP